MESREEEHLFKVFRAQPGSSVQLLDGRGGVASGVVLEKRKIEIISREYIPEPQEKLHLCCAIPKRQKLDQLLKQVTELGVWSIRPLRCERSVAEGGSRERWELHLREACKQSGNPFLPRVLDDCSVDEALDELNASNIDVYYGSVTPCKAEIPGKLKSEKAIFIGPEGGFSPDELSLIGKKGGKALNFGPYTLRLETAAVAGLAVLRTVGMALIAGVVMFTAAGCGCGDDLNPLLEKAHALSEEGNFEESRKYYREAVARYPESADAFYQLGKLCEERFSDRVDQLEALFCYRMFLSKAAEDDPNRADVESLIQGLESRLGGNEDVKRELSELQRRYDDLLKQHESLKQHVVKQQTIWNRSRR